MDWNRVEGNWKLKGKVKEKWDKERYGIAKDQVRRGIDDWYNTQRW
jgi:uncharacterized protein YjbJ (UPF0337 family)